VTGRQWGPAFSNASSDDGDRLRAVQETLAALELAKLVPVQVLVLHLGLPDTLAIGRRQNSRDAVLRSIGAIADAAAPLGVQVALENIPAALSTPESIAALVDEVDRPNVGACLDMGHAHLMGGVPDAVETFADVLVAAHVHDNHGTRDDHLPPYEGTIGWPATCMALRKIGYSGVLMLEIAPDAGDTAGMLARIDRARARLAAEFADDGNGHDRAGDGPVTTERV
jgi:sugar phosphate isomerase/epimerase